MKNGKILTLSIIAVQFILITSSINAFTIRSDSKEIEKINSNSIEIFQQFSPPKLIENDNLLTIQIKETNSFLTETGNPILPIYLKTIEFPLGTRMKEITCTYSEPENLFVEKKIISQPKPQPYYIENDKKNEFIYNNYYPENWYSYKLSGGLNKKNEHTTFLTIQINPVRYNPFHNDLQFIDFIKLDITYEEPNQPILFPDEYDLLIISYDWYKPLLKPLVTHKESHNIKTKIVNV